MSRLVAAPRRIEFVHLRTNNSPPVALHLASQRRSYLRLRSLWHTPARTFTVLMWRLHGRTHSRTPLAGIQAEFRLPPGSDELRQISFTVDERKPMNHFMVNCLFISDCCCDPR